MAAPAGRWVEDESLGSVYGRCKAVFPHGGGAVTVAGLLSAEVARLVCDILAVREAVEAGQELGTLPLHRQRPGAPSAPGAAVACLIRGTSLQQLAQQLQDCSTPAIQCWENFRSLESAARLAATLGHACALQILLLLDPAAASAANIAGRTPLHAAAQAGQAAAARLLLDAAPGAAAAADSLGCTPLHLAACHSKPAVVPLLLRAAPTAAAARDLTGKTPLHVAAQHGCPAVVRMLLAAAPEMAQARDADGRTPLQLALAAGTRAAGLPDLLAAAPVLSDEQWAAVPSPCPGLGRVLPAALQRSEAEARRVMRLLPEEEAGRLRLFALCLVRSQRRLGTQLPSHLVGTLLALAAAA